MKRCQIPAVAFYSLLLVSALLFLGCEVGSSDSVTRDVGANYSGVYDAQEGGVFVDPANSGARVNSFILRQSGDQLEAIDNNNLVFNGSLNEVTVESGNSEAGFSLKGRTTAGADVTISGTLTGVGTAGTIKGTWIESDRYCLLLGDGTINAAPTSSTQKVSAPTFSPAAGSFAVSVTVTVSTATSGATIRYTTDSSDPTSSSAQYSTPLIFSATTTLKARGFASGMTDSDVSSATYTEQ